MNSKRCLSVTTMLSTGTLLLLLAACSAKVSTDGGGAPPAPAPDVVTNKDAVTGPTIDGKWSSTCHASSFVADKKRVDGSIIIHLSINSRSVERKTERFSDANCTPANALKTQTLTGSFRYLALQSTNVYTIEYRFDLGGGVSTMPQESIKFENDTLSVSNFQISPDIILTRDTAAAPQPAAPAAPAAPSAPAATCTERDSDMRSLDADAENDIRDAYHGVGQGTVMAADLRKKVSAFKAKYSGLSCDGETTESFTQQITSIANQIESMQ